MKNGIIINGKKYELVDVPNSAPLNYCDDCDLLDTCNKVSGNICEIYDGKGDCYFKIKK